MFILILKKFIFSFKKIILNTGIIKIKEIRSKKVTIVPPRSIVRKKNLSFFV
jgi:hypothetical protein